MDKQKQLVFECSCGNKTSGYNGMWQSETGEISVVWKCGKCKKTCIAVIAGMKPKLSWPIEFTEEDQTFLHEYCNTYIKED